MKHFFYVILFSFISFTTVAQSNKNQKAVIKTFFNCSHCKQCESCGKNFQKNLFKISGLKMFEIDEKNMTITVYFNENKTNLETIKSAISKLGFNADEIKADEIATAKLDSCCRPK